MALPEDLTELMTDTVTLEPAVQPPDRNNKFSYGAAIEVGAYIVRANKRVLDRRGRELISTVQVFLADPELVVTADDRLTLEDGSRPAIIQVLGGKDEDGNDYWLELRA